MPGDDEKQSDIRGAPSHTKRLLCWTVVPSKVPSFQKYLRFKMFVHFISDTVEKEL